MLRVMQERKAIYFCAVVISILLSAWSAVREVIVNPDAICYLLSAQSMSSGLHYAMHLCGQAKWPFYSILIAGMAAILKLPLLTAAYVLNGIFSAISVVAFLSIVRLLAPSVRMLWLAAATILLFHEFNALREFIIRDHGFWAFYLLSIVFLLRYFRQEKLCYALLWNASLCIATLFRIEGICFLLLLPFIALIVKKHSFLSFLKLNVLTIIGLICITVGMGYSGTDLGRLNELHGQLIGGAGQIMQNFHAATAGLKQYVLNQYAAHDAALLWFLTLSFSYLINVGRTVSLIYAVLIVYAWSRQLLKVERTSHAVLWGYILVNVAVTVIFFAEHMFLSKRYLVALALTLMVWVPFSLDALYQQCEKRRWPLLAAAFLILVSALGGIFDFGSSKYYIRDAGDWLRTHLPEQATLYSNDYQVMYYSGRFGNDIFKKGREFSQANSHWQQYNYVAWRLDRKSNPAVMNQFGVPIQVFKNKRGDQVVIYKINPKGAL